MNIKKNISEFIIIIIISILIFLFYFYFNFQEPNYFICSEIKTYDFILFDTILTFKYPESCDQAFYHEGFSNLISIFSPDFNYQLRPLYFIPVNIIFNILNYFSINELFNLYFSTFIFQNIISFIIIKLILSTIKSKKKIDFISVALIILLSPLFKWGIFDPSHQLFTSFVLIYFVYLASKNYRFHSLSSFSVGILFLLHRSFLISFFWYIFLKDIKNIKQNIFYKIKLFLLSLIPYISYNFLIYLIFNQRPYDANTLYWGQFVWLYDFIRGKVRYESEWHCVTIPQNFICYFKDNFHTLNYLVIPLALLLVLLLINYRKVSNKTKLVQYQLISISLFIYLFWSLIGWYPPIRFSYYSIGNLIIILFAIHFVELKNNKIKLFTILPYFTFSLYLNHWNDPNLLSYNYGIYFSFILFAILLFISIFEKNKYKIV